MQQHREIKFMRLLFILLSLIPLSSCKTKTDIRREQEVEKLKSELRDVKGDKADAENQVEELKLEIGRINNVVEERAQQNRAQMEELRREFNREIAQLSARIQANEQRAAQEETVEKQKVQERSRASYENGRRLYDDGKYEDAIEVLKVVSRKGARTDEGKKSLFLLGESYYANKEFASAALEFSEFKKLYPKDNLIPQAIYRQAVCFKNMGKPKEAKLFYQELIDRYPKANMIAKAKQEMKKLR
jgi:TolA-binding protein